MKEITVEFSVTQNKIETIRGSLVGETVWVGDRCFLVLKKNNVHLLIPIDRISKIINPYPHYFHNIDDSVDRMVG
jgi:hypothetical protein